MYEALRAEHLGAEVVASVCGGAVQQTGSACRAISTDSRQPTAGGWFVALKGPRHDGHDHLIQAVRGGAKGVLVQEPLAKGLLPPSVAVVQVPDTTRALLTWATAHRRACATPVVGITGSCGKTTTKDMLGPVLAIQGPAVWSKASFNNHIGVPLTLFQLQPETTGAVVEIGTNGPGEIGPLSRAAAPDLAIVTCVAPAHLERLKTLDGIAEEKADLVRALPKGAPAILNGDDPRVRGMARGTGAREVLVRVDGEADWFATDVQFHGLGTSFKLQGQRLVNLPRIGSHNVYNALFVLAAAAELGIPEEAAVEVLGGLPASHRRMEHYERAGVEVFDDTYNMNPASARAALAALGGMAGTGRRIAVFGTMLELGAASDELHRNLGEEIHHRAVDVLVCVGTGAMAIAEGARGAGMDAEAVFCVDDTDAAVDLLGGLVRSGDRVLCKASRGVQLERAVEGLLKILGRRRSGTGGRGAKGGNGEVAET